MKKIFDSVVFWVILLALVMLATVVAIGWCKYKDEKRTPNINNIAQTIAKTNKWFDYSYDVVENYDESGTKRYHVKFYYTIENDSKYHTVEYVIAFENNDYIAEVVK